MLSLKSLLLAGLPTLSLAKGLKTQTLGQLPEGTWLENIAVRDNSDLLVTQLSPDATIYTLKKPAKGLHSLEPFHKFDSIDSLLGITQVEALSGKETYVVVGSNTTGTGKPVPGTFETWKITFTGAVCVTGDKLYKAEKISDMSEDSLFLNGLTDIPGLKDVVLVADSATGLVGHLDLETDDFDPYAFDYPGMKPLEDAPLPIGVNGIKVWDSYLYWTNSFRASIFRIHIDSDDGYPEADAEPELVVDLASKLKIKFLDDFTFDNNGNIWVATNFNNSIVFGDLKTDKWEIIAGSTDKLTLGGATAVAFGRDPKNKYVLYASTSGAEGAPVNGKTEGGKVVAIDTLTWMGKHGYGEE